MILALVSQQTPPSKLLGQSYNVLCVCFDKLHRLCKTLEIGYLMPFNHTPLTLPGVSSSTYAAGSNERRHSRGFCFMKNSSGVRNLTPTLSANPLDLLVRLWHNTQHLRVEIPIRRREVFRKSITGDSSPSVPNEEGFLHIDAIGPR